MTKSDIYSEDDVIKKIIIPWLQKMGYNDEDLSQEHHIPVGRTEVRADIVIKLGNKPSFVIDGKNPRENLDHYEIQILSYGALLKVKYGVLCNGIDFRVYDIEKDKLIWDKPITKLPQFLGKKQMIKTKSGRISTSRIELAKTTLIQIEGIKQLTSLFHKCEDLIRDNDGLTGEDAFDQMSKMLFMKMWFEKTNKSSNPFSLDTINNAGGANYVKGFLFTQVKKNNPDLIENNEELKMSDDTIMSIIEYFDDYTLLDTEVDIKGKAFEIFLGKTLTGNLGQFFTPRTVVDFVVKMVDPDVTTRNKMPYLVLDPSCGTGGFLITAFLHMCKKIQKMPKPKRESYTKKLAENQIFGVDINPRLTRVAKMNMFLHGDGHGGIYTFNGLLDKNKSYSENFDLIVTNPPFGNDVKDPSILKQFELARGKSKQDAENLFIERCINCLKPNGTLAIILPDGVLNDSRHYVRSFITKHMIIDAVVSLPIRTFKSVGANSKTSIVFMRKKEKQNQAQPPVFMAVASEIGFERKTKLAKEIAENDLINILEEYKKYKKQRSSIQEYKILQSNPPCFILSSHLIKNRLDATFYYAEYIFTIKGPNCRVKDIANLSFVSDDRKISPYSLIHYIEYNSIDEHMGDITTTKTHVKVDAPNRAKYVATEGDVICAKMLDSEKNVAIIPSSLHGQLVSNGFVILRPKKPMTSASLFIILRKNTTTNQVRWRATGTIMPTISPEDYMNLKVPKITDNKIKSYTEKITMFAKQTEEKKSYLKKAFSE